MGWEYILRPVRTYRAPIWNHQLERDSMKNKQRFDGTFPHKDGTAQVTLLVLLWEEGGVHFVYSPHLDMTGYGKSEREAKESFEITLSEFVKYTHNKGTVYRELERLGWTVNVKKKRVKGPTDEELKQDNETYRELLTRDNVRTMDRRVEFAL